MEAVGASIHRPRAFRSCRSTGRPPRDLKPRREDFADLEAIVFDVADVGSRYYTYIWTMLLAMEACAGSRLRFVVCDRPNPIGGAVEGAPQATGYLTFVGLHPIPVRHGMTAGELARLFAAERRLDLDLVVCPAAGWARDMPFAETGLPWVAPSPNMPTTDTALVYPGHVPARGHEPLRGPRDDAAVRGLRRAVARADRGRRRAQRARAAGRPVPSDRSSGRCSTSTPASRAAARSMHVTDRGGVPAVPDGAAGHRDRAAAWRRSTSGGARSPTSTTTGRRSTC